MLSFHFCLIIVWNSEFNQCKRWNTKLKNNCQTRHFEPANNYQRYIVLHSGTIECQENSIWQRSRLDLQRSVFRTMAYTIWAPQIFYLMKRKRKEDLQVNLWDFSRQSDDMMSEFWFALIKFSRQDYWICIQRLAYFYSEQDLRTYLFPCKNINKYGRRFEDQRC